MDVLARLTLLLADFEEVTIEEVAHAQHGLVLHDGDLVLRSAQMIEAGVDFIFKLSWISDALMDHALSDSTEFRGQTWKVTDALVLEQQ